MELRPGYKQTDIGVLPKDWDACSIRELVDRVRLGGNYPNSERETSRPLIKMGNMGRGNISTSKLEYIPDGFPVDEHHRLKSGDVIFNTRNTLDLVGKVCIWRDELPVAYYNSNVLRLEFSKLKICSNDYANYALNAHKAVLGLREIATGTTSVAAIYTRDFLEFRIPVPPLAEQCAIAAALSDADALIASLDALIAKKRDLKHAAMQQLLSGKRRLPGFTVEWEVKRLGDVGRCLRGVTYKGDSDLSTHDTAETKRLLRSNNVQDAIVTTSDLQFVNFLRVSASQILKLDDILVCMANGSKALVGKAGRFTTDDGFQYTFGAFMGCFRTNASVANPAFVFALFQTSKYRDYINNLLAGSSINNLSPRSIESLEFDFPSQTEQTAIAEILSDIDADLAAEQAKCDKARALKRGMMQELLTGRTRLV
jgi:type I restriction enzyme S subunit